MRELYATELRSKTDTNMSARSYVSDWATRHDSADVSTVDNDDGSCIVSLRQIDDKARLEWRSDISLGPPTELAHVTVRVRLGALTNSGVAPIDYEFGTPAIVRTLTRMLTMHDGSVRCEPDLPSEVGPSGVTQLLAELTDQERSWPVVVVSRAEPGGAVLTDARTLCRELAGLAHVRVLSSASTSWELTKRIGKEHSVWGGAVRIYFPGFAPGPEDDPRRHRITFPDRVNAETTTRLRTWLGTLAAAATAEHPAILVAREKRRELVRVAVTSRNADELLEWIQVLEDENLRLDRDSKDYKQEAAELRKKLGRAESDLEHVKGGFAEMQRSMASPANSSSEAVDENWPATIDQAMDAVEELANTGYYRRGVILSPAAVRSGRQFKSYARPEQLMRSCQAVFEAGIRYHDNTLGVSPGEFFKSRGFGYGAQPGPHLKVDDHTSPDQCLRIYWTDDSTTRVWTVTKIGEHD